MAKSNSFDVMAEVDHNEVRNAVQQTMKEVRQRFDFKGSKSEVSLEENELVQLSEDDFKLRQLNDVMEQKMVKRDVPLKALEYGAVEAAAGSMVRRRIAIQQGIPIEKCREIVKAIKTAKLKVQAAIQGDLVRVSGRDRDVLQDVIALLKDRDFGIHMSFGNYRSN